MSTTKPIPLIFGETLFDCFAPDECVLGGAAFNVARHLQAWGCDPLLLSRVGNDRKGHAILEAMRQFAMNTSGMQVDEQRRSGQVNVSLQNGQPHFVIEPLSAYDFIAAENLPVQPPALIYHGSLALRQRVSAQTLDDIVRRYSSPLFMDVNLRTPWWNREELEQRMHQATWVKLNHDELQALYSPQDGLRSKAEAFMQQHSLQRVIVSCGERGAFALDQQQGYAEVTPPEKLEVIDTVGAGDAFASVCLLGILSDWPLQQTLDRAQQFASLIVCRRGAVPDDDSLYQGLKASWSAHASA
ncbi:MAG: carbohydrate kinase [gamma proteobacterium symbiont of Bathyaustriella thionipta]|nr:carbohydrate kinase [gamma proteobacterium symbiont of Bathyaustriella thionipta]